MKPNRSGLMVGSGANTREVGPANKWVSLATKPKGTHVGLAIPLTDAVRVGHHTSRPPDPPRASSIGIYPSGAPANNLDDSRAQIREEEDGAQAITSAAAKMEDVKMEFGAAGTPSTQTTS